MSCLCNLDLNSSSVIKRTNPAAIESTTSFACSDPNSNRLFAGGQNNRTPKKPMMPSTPQPRIGLRRSKARRMEGLKDLFTKISAKLVTNSERKIIERVSSSGMAM